MKQVKLNRQQVQFLCELIDSIVSQDLDTLASLETSKRKLFEQIVEFSKETEENSAPEVLEIDLEQIPKIMLKSGGFIQILDAKGNVRGLTVAEFSQLTLFM